MYRLRKRGMGDVLDPTSSGALKCGLFAGGVFNKACWCLEWPSLCGSADYVAAKVLADPSLIAAIQAPPTVGAPTGAALTTPPANAADAQAEVDAILAQQLADWNAQNAATIAQTKANLDQVAQNQPITCFFGTATQADDGTWSCVSSSTNWLLYGALAVGVLALVSMGGGGSARRYGR
jgi:hypothetical protein